jgi:peptidoglycan/LPS O-acetylase OafA/YrhL
VTRATGWIPALEGLRGVASLVVVLRHVVGAAIVPVAVRRAVVEGPLAPLVNADGAIAIFFVLSGVVLAGSVDRQSRAPLAPRSLLRFGVKRVARIHLPYVAAVALAWLASFHYALPAAVGSPWIRSLSEVHIGAGEMLRALAFPGTASLQLPVGWTLEIEMAFSLVFPLLWALTGRLHWLIAAVLVLPLPFVEEPPLRAAFAIDFVLGIAIHRERERLSLWLGKLRGVWAAVILAGCVFLLVLPEWTGWGAGLGWGDRSRDFEALRLLARTAGAAGLVALAAHLPAIGRIFELRPCLFLGRTSYALYLIHIPVVIVMLRLLPESSRGLPLLSALQLALLTLAVALPASAAFHRFVESPSIRLGRTLTSRLDGPGGAPSARNA